ncbi:MAG TPA: DUF3397 domain-containing protein [Bacillota bacterium]|nr:DUF3397 domain-containing protein [Bacillota bacterium]
MKHAIIYTLSIIITLPFILTYLLYYLHLMIYKQSLRSLHFAINWTTMLYILSVVTIVHLLFQQTIVSYILLFMLITLSIIIYYQWKENTEVSIALAIKLLWRFCFLLFFSSYSLLVIVGIFMHIV